MKKKSEREVGAGDQNYVYSHIPDFFLEDTLYNHTLVTVTS